MIFSLYIGNSFIFKGGSRVDLGLRGGTRGVNAVGGNARGVSSVIYSHYFYEQMVYAQGI